MYPPDGSLTSPQSGRLDTSPLLTYSIANHLLRSRRQLRCPPQLRGAASRLLRMASSRGMMLREPSVRVRENAAEQLEETQSGWGYSKPVVVIDVFWNLAFVIIAVAVLGASLQERPKVPLRVWIVGYGLQCLCHVVCVVVEYRKRRNLGVLESGILSSRSGDSLDFWTQQSGNDGVGTSVAKRVESASTMFSVIWWIIGFYWVTTAGRQNLEENSSQLYWLCITFLAFDALFVIICVAAACLIGIAVCCCLPCIIGILYAMTDQTEENDQGKYDAPTCKALVSIADYLRSSAVCLEGISQPADRVLLSFLFAFNSQNAPLALALERSVSNLALPSNWEQEGATTEEIDRLPKYKFCRIEDFEEVDGKIRESCGGTMTECDTNAPIERALSHEDAECCICLSAYEDGSELRELPCNHHFHCVCIDKWLCINATCPLCKFNIVKTDSESGRAEA
ncbi:unnamed protein product [Dovyalis caffra]|uniref:RING-type E3 ubiquitin transferase n=1 Tax=Dovyalis caffra TaxID=77055 RepID=A0AAV1SCZ7_9ROSI|nr:unnamed protein product [Dovyalis caffra]